jgi:hypothetical protein
MTVKVDVYLPGYDPLATTEARAEYLQTLRRQGRISAELERNITENLPITAAKRQEVEDAYYRLVTDRDWYGRLKRGDQVARSEFTEIKAWRGRPVQG